MAPTRIIIETCYPQYSTNKPVPIVRARIGSYEIVTYQLVIRLRI
ncbi:hypothetical protein CORMATOL_02765 [Corynebacterium matruchotii ATCC 33806]|uniref:Uncharacterized protein n=1 Tax=Corynebacterium matruchotii ATCC 33806 TaxID=566549 RepID=C0E6X7_9CORY|nr:hypothetical protein CORMATOL_02765 [Corynebacterium matruchotii ATCC 33806]